MTTTTTTGTQTPAMNREDRKRRTRRWWIRAGVIAVFTVLTAWSLIPLIWSLSASFKPTLEIYDSALLPSNPTLGNYVEALGVTGFPRFTMNSLIFSVTSMLGAVVASVLCAYAFVRFRFRGRHLLLLLVFLPRLVPRVALTIPLYDVIRGLGMLDEYLPIIIIYTASSVPLGTWIMIGFLESVPLDLEEAAMIDGANTMQVLRRIVLPLAIPGILAVSVLAFREAWNEFAIILTLTTSVDIRTLPYALFLLQDSLGVQNWGVVQAFGLATIAPLILIYLRFEKYVVSGLTAGAVK